MQTIVIQSHLIRSLLADTLQEIKNLRKELQTGRNGRENNSSFFSKYPKLQFPLNSLEDLEELEGILKNEEDFEDGVSKIPFLLISYMQKIGTCLTFQTVFKIRFQYFFETKLYLIG